ncbi:MAG: hypothetical protein IRZ03_08450 [Acidobacterium ailaaui]|nr:hypothetical protein [Pseudacidobacterium ailaaui]
MADRTVSVKLKADVASYMASMRSASAATRDLETAAREVRKAHDEEANAAGAVRVAEAQLAEVRSKASSKTSELVAAEERLAKAHRALQAAREKTAAAEQSFLELQEKAGADAGDAFGKGYERETSKAAARANAQFNALLTAGLAVGGGVAAGVGAAISTAAIAGTAAAIIGLGAAALSTDQKVVDAFHDMAAGIKADARDIAAPLEGPIIQSLGRLEGAFHGMAPELRRDAEAVAPAIDQMTTGLISMAREALPGINALATNSLPVFRGLSDVASGAGIGFTDFATKVASSSDAVEKDLDILARVISNVLGSLGGVVSNLASNTQAVDAFGRIIEEAAHTLELLTENGGAAMSALTGFSTTAGGLIHVLNGVLTILNSMPAGFSQFLGMLAGGAVLANKFGFSVKDAFTKGGDAVAGFRSKVGLAVGILSVIGAIENALVKDSNDVTTSVDGMSSALQHWAATGQVTGDLAKAFGSDLSDMKRAFDIVNSTGFSRAIAYADDFAASLVGAQGEMSNAKDYVSRLDQALTAMVNNGQSAEAANIVSKIAAQTGQSIDAIQKQLPGYMAAQQAASTATAQNAAALKDLGSRAEAAAKLVDTLTNALNNLIQPELDSREAARNLEQAIDDASQAVRENGRTLDINTEAGRNNQEALDGIASSANQLINAMVKAGASQRDIAAKMDEARTAFINTATAMGMPKQAAEELATQLGLISSHDWNVAVGANVGTATDQVNNFLAFVSAQSATAKVFGDTDPAMGAVRDWQNVTRQTDGTTTTYTYTDPATKAVTQWKVTTDATGATTTTYSFTDPATGAVYSWQRFADGTWGTVHVGADTSAANAAIDYAARTRTAIIRVVTQGTFSYAVGPGGTSTSFYYGPRAEGGIDVPGAVPMARGGILGPTMRHVASVVPPNMPRLIGDNTRVPESFIPWDGSQRSRTILEQTMNAFGIQPAENQVQRVIQSGNAVQGSPATVVASSPVVNNFSFPNYVGSREELISEIRKAVRIKGGDVQKVLGR